MEEFFIKLPIVVNITLIALALYIVIRASHIMVDGAVSIAHLFRISPLVIGATVVAMGTSFAELAVNLVVVLGGGDTSTVVGNILGSNLVNIGIELGVAVLIAGFIVVPRDAIEKDIPIYIAATGMMTALIVDGEIGRLEAILMLFLFVVAVSLIVQYASTQHVRSELVVEVTPLEGISHPLALELTQRQAILALFGGLAVLVLASRLLILSTSALATVMNVPWFIIGLVIIGPGTSLPEIASSLQAARRGHADLVLGTAFGSNLFNLLFGLGLPALFHPLIVEQSAISSFFFMSFVNLSFALLVLMDRKVVGRNRTINRTVGSFLVITYVAFISYLVVDAAEGTLAMWLQIIAVLTAFGLIVFGIYYWMIPRASIIRRRDPCTETKYKILCATRGGKASQPTHSKAIEIALERDAELEFLYVFDRSALPREATPLVINVEAQIRHMREYLQKTAGDQAKKAGVQARIIVRAGSLLDQLSAVVIEDDIDLVILGNPKERGSLFKREALRALASDIASATGKEVFALIDDSIESYIV